MLIKSVIKQKDFPIRQRHHKGQAMLVAILIITAATLAIALAVTVMGSSELNIGLASRDSEKAYGLAETCLEDTLMRMARTNTITPPVFTLSSGSCTINISGSAPYVVTSTGQVGKTYRKVRATVSISNEVLTVSEWREYY